MTLPDSVGYSAWQPWELEKSTAIYQMKNLVKQMQKYSSSKNQLYQ